MINRHLELLCFHVFRLWTVTPEGGPEVIYWDCQALLPALQLLSGISELSIVILGPFSRLVAPVEGRIYMRCGVGEGRVGHSLGFWILNLDGG